MKKRWIVIAIIVIGLLIVSAVTGYVVIEKAEELPENMRSMLEVFSGRALAETQPSAMETAVPPPVRPQYNLITQVRPQATAEPVTTQQVELQQTAQPLATIPPKGTPPTSAPQDMIPVQPSDMPIEMPVITITPVPEPTPIPTPTPRLENGSRGAEVKKLQQRLHELGFFNNKIDGIYGAKTEQAVKDFRQHMYDLEQERIAAEQARLEAERARLEAEQAAQNALTQQPAAEPTEVPIEQPTGEPTEAPTEQPTVEPTEAPTEQPTGEPTEAPTEQPTGEPTEAPTEQPAAEPTEAPTEQPTGEPTEAPTEQSEAELPVIEGKVDDETYHLLLEGGFDEYQMKLLSGMSGVEVKRLQMRLKSLGYLTGAADGIFGQKTVTAVKAFQQRNSLTQDGIAGEKTQRKLFSSSALKYELIDYTITPEQREYTGNPYFVKVSTKNQRVYVYSWNKAEGAYCTPVRTMICSTGLAETPTPKGTYSSSTGPEQRWGYFKKFDVWAQYWYRISGPYLFHSVLYSEKDESTLRWGSVNKLGSPASHGCVRLKVEDAKWIYENCPAGTTVQVV